MTSGLATYVMTAGLSSDDYRFLGRAPKEAFWRRYADYSSFERPTAILLCRDSHFRAYLSGVASARRDRTKTPLRYTLVLEGPCRTPAADLVLRALQSFVDDLAALKPGPLTPGSLGRALDSAFPEPFVESALAALRDSPSATTGPLAEIESRADTAFRSLSADPPEFPTDLRFSHGGHASPVSRTQFVSFAERLLFDGEPGAALVLNLASPEHAVAIGGDEPSCSILFARPDAAESHQDPVEWPPKKGRPGSPTGLPRAIALREAQEEPGLSTRFSQMFLGALRTVRDFLLGRRRASS
ncbi:MAG: hypothetical protein R3B70_26405 [Polyangiaceae bacterium]